MSYLQAILRTEFSFIANTAGKLATFGLVALFAYGLFPKNSVSPEFGLIMVFLAGLAGNLVMTALIFWHAKKFHKIRFYWDSEYIKKILKMSIPYGIALFLGVIFFKVDTLFLSLMEDASVSDAIIGIYSIPMKIVEVGMMYGTIFLNSFLPVLTASISEKRIDDTKNLSLKGFELLFGFGVGISVFLAFFAEKIIPFISSESFLVPINGANSVDVMQIVAWIFLFYFISSLANYILIAKNEQKKIIYVNLFIALVNIVGNLVIIPFYSFIGSAVVTLASQVLLVIISLFLVRDTLYFAKILSKSALLLCAGIFSGCITFMAMNFFSIKSLFFSLALTGSIFGILYLAFWWLIRKIP